MAKEIKEAEEKQEPVKPPKKSSGDISIVTIVGVIGGAVVIMFLLLVVFFMFFVKPYLGGGHSKDTAKTEQTEEKKEAKMPDNEITEEFGIKNKEFMRFAATEKIVTNPKGSSSQFVVIRIGVEYIQYNKEGKPEPPAAAATEKGVPTFEGSMKAKIEGQVLAFMGSYTIDEFQAKRDSLPALFKMRLKDTFKEDMMKIKDVVIMEFLIQ